MSRHALLIVACAFALSGPAIAGDTALAPTISPNVMQMQRAQSDTNSLTERVNLLEMTVKKQQAQIADLQNNLVQQRDQLSQAIKAAQQSASQAYSTAAQAIQSAAAAQSGVSALNAKAPGWDAVAGAFPNHTHSYDKTKVGYQNHNCQNASAGPDSVPCSQITGTTAMTLKTSPPQ